MFPYPLLNKTFKEHPVHKDLWVSSLGAVYNKVTDKLYSWDEEVNGYKCIRYNGRSYSVHVLVAETHVEKPNDIPHDQLIVNHLDGIKCNNKASNLEWTTYSNNSIHAYKNGLWPNTKPILCKHIKTNEIQRFYSLSECARHFVVNNSKVYSYLNAKSKTIWMENFILVYEGDPWPEKIAAKKPSILLSLKDLKTGDVKMFHSVNEAAEFLNVSYYHIWKNKKSANIFELNGFEIKITEDSTFVSRFKKPGNLIRKSIPVITTCLKTGVVKKYDSSESLADELGVCKNTLQKHIWVNKGIWKNTLSIMYDNCPS